MSQDAKPEAGTDAQRAVWLSWRDPVCSPEAVTRWLELYGSPLLVYSEAALCALADGFLQFAAATSRRTHSAFALKACPNHSVLQLLRARGLLAEVNSVPEYLMALDAGFTPQQIHVNGVAKSPELIGLALQKGCRALHLDSVEEIDLIAARAVACHRRLPVQLRLCPEVGSAAAPGLMTGHLHSPFGIAQQDLPAAWEALRHQRAHLCLQGLHLHAGSGGELAAVYPQLIEVMCDAHAASAAAGPEQALEVNLGGGFVSDPQQPYTVRGADALLREIARLPAGLSLMFEPGRFLVEYAAALYCRVAALKNKAGVHWVLLDAGYCHLSDRATVDTRFPLRALRESASQSAAQVAGPLCDSVDTYRPPVAGDAREAAAFYLPTDLRCGDPIEIGSAGAYVYSTGNRFAGFCQPAVLLASADGRARLIRRSERYQDLRALELAV